VRNVRGSAEGDLMVQPAFEGANISSATGIFAQGPVADDVASTGNPVVMGGVAIEVDKTDPGEVTAAADVAFARMDLNRRVLVNTTHPQYFNILTLITTADVDTAVVAAVSGMRAHITDIVIATTQTAALGEFTLTNDAGTAIFGPIPVTTEGNGGNGIGGIFKHNFNTPLVNETQNNQVEMDKSAGEDDWVVFLAGYYAP